MTCIPLPEFFAGYVRPKMKIYVAAEFCVAVNLSLIRWW